MAKPKAIEDQNLFDLYISNLKKFIRNSVVTNFATTARNDNSVIFQSRVQSMLHS